MCISILMCFYFTQKPYVSVIGYAQKTRNEVWGAWCTRSVRSTGSRVSGWFHWQQPHCTYLVGFAEINQNMTIWLSSPNTLQEASIVTERADGCQRSRAWNLRSVIESRLLQILSSYATTLVVLQFSVKYMIELSLPLFLLESVIEVMLLQISTDCCGHSIQR